MTKPALKHSSSPSWALRRQITKPRCCIYRRRSTPTSPSQNIIAHLSHPKLPPVSPTSTILPAIPTYNLPPSTTSRDLPPSTTSRDLPPRSPTSRALPPLSPAPPHRYPNSSTALHQLHATPAQPNTESPQRVSANNTVKPVSKMANKMEIDYLLGDPTSPMQGPAPHVLPPQATRPAPTYLPPPAYDTSARNMGTSSNTANSNANASSSKPRQSTRSRSRKPRASSSKAAAAARNKESRAKAAEREESAMAADAILSLSRGHSGSPSSSQATPKTAPISMKRTSNKERPYMCVVCRYEFSKREHLKRHVLLVHYEQRPYTCDICNLNFGTKQNMQVHFNTKKHRQRLLLKNTGENQEKKN